MGLVGEAQRVGAGSNRHAGGDHVLERAPIDILVIEGDDVDAIGEGGDGIRVVGATGRDRREHTMDALVGGIRQGRYFDAQRNRRLGDHAGQLSAADDAHAGHPGRVVVHPGVAHVRAAVEAMSVRTVMPLQRSSATPAYARSLASTTSTPLPHTDSTRPPEVIKAPSSSLATPAPYTLTPGQGPGGGEPIDAIPGTQRRRIALRCTPR